LLAAVALLALAAASDGCGGSSPAERDPASVVPLGAPLYVSFTIEPGGGPRGAAVSDLQRLTHLADPYGSIAETLLEGVRARPSFRSQIEPWIGRSVGVFLMAAPMRLTGAAGTRSGMLSPAAGVTALLRSLGARGFETGGAQGALVTPVSDRSGALAFLDRRAAEQGAHAVSYRGVRLELSRSGCAEGLVNGYAVIGSEPAVKEVIDTSLGAVPLTHAAGYLKPPSGAIATAHFASGRTSQLFDQFFHAARGVALSLTAERGSLVLQAATRADGGSEPLLGPGAASALRSLPGGSWLALGAGADPRSGAARWGALLRSIGGSGLPSAIGSLAGGGVARVLAALSPSSASLGRSFARWAGSAALFVSGTSLLDLQAALVVASSDPLATRATLGQLAALARRAGAHVAPASIPGAGTALSVELAGFPAVLYLAVAQSKLVVGLGRASVSGALHPAGALAASPAYATAAAALGAGIQPGAIVEFPTLVTTLEAIGAAQSPALSATMPYLRSLGTLVVGASLGGVEASGLRSVRLRAVLSLAGAGGG
jgi:hypothetical protein